ncbi:hypothetical protein [Marinifilum fragile]|uniref:hypothetical protein n=1 Tax=Marinifilum fragile TaxID=570161 RepID=UPI0006D08E1F|nr:hypothetical protein [Marinifilum fragile]
MNKRKTRSEVQVLESYRIALTNVELQPEIAATMAEFGYTTEVIAEGKTLLSETQNAWNFNKQEDNETLEAYAIFSEKDSALDGSYNLHRKKAKVVFRNDNVMLQKLALSGRTPKAYASKVATMKTFYSEIIADTEIQTKLARLKFPKEEADAGMTAILELEASRTAYLRETGESQEATQAKDAAFDKLDKWMQEFYAVAKIAMDDKPQLLEALGILVRN